MMRLANGWMAALIGACLVTTAYAGALTTCTIVRKTADEVMKCIRGTLLDADFLAHERRHNRVHVVFDVAGNFVRPDIAEEYPYLDENDVLIVHQVVNAREADFTGVKVNGDLSVPLFRLAGTNLTSARAFRQDVDAPAPDPEQRFFLSTSKWGPFKEGAVYELKKDDPPEARKNNWVHVTALIKGKDDKKADAAIEACTVKLNRRDLYHFQATGGLFYSKLTDREFKSNTGVVRLDEGREYAVAFCILPYVWDSAGVDLYHLPEHGLKRISPLIGFGFEDLLKDFYLGLAYQLGRGVYLSAGAHVVKTEVLFPGQAIGGTPVPGLPLSEEQWETEGFAGITFPLDVFNGFKGKVQAYGKEPLDKPATRTKSPDAPATEASAAPGEPAAGGDGEPEADSPPEASASPEPSPSPDASPSAPSESAEAE